MPPAWPLLKRHLALLESMGWWGEAEEFLEQFGEAFLNKNELDGRLRLIRENRSIHAKAELLGQSFIGENDIVELRRDNIRLTYHLKEHADDVADLFRHVVRSLDILRNNLEYRPKGVDIRLHGFQSEIHLGEGDLESGGVFDGRIHINPRHAGSSTSCGLLLSHELVHQAVADLTKGRCPKWLDEGLALFISQNLPDRYLESLARLSDGGLDPIPLEALEGGVCFQENSTVAKLAHAQAFSLAEYLVETLGWSGVRRLLLRTAQTSPDMALNDFSLNYYLLERQWLRRMKTVH